ncbi:MAG: protein TolQ [Hydrogenophilales bacterium]|nr:protein TolQ [Hydrogenophilales bacterium]
MELSLTQDVSMMQLVMQASWVVKLVMLLLLTASVASWWIVFSKFQMLRREGRLAREFERNFWEGKRDDLVKRMREGVEGGSMEAVFRAGFKEWTRLQRQAGLPAASAIESVRRAMRAAYQREMDALEGSLPFLATVGSVSPYVGLFGTVWGIMNSFRGLANVAQTTLAHVAPGIAEALIATAIGLFAAIPAVIAYNRFTYDLDRLANRFDVFMEEFSNLLQREMHRP